MKKLFSLLMLFVLSSGLIAAEDARLLRFPSTNGQIIVFTYAGDLYSVPVAGGIARKLTSHDGYEMFSKFSPDGKSIAFTAQYDGNTEVYLIPSEGGVPKRLTYTATLGRDDVSDRMGPNNIVMAWTSDGKNIVYRSRQKSFNDFVGQLYKVSAEGGPSEQLPLSTGGFCSFSADGQKLAFNRVFREFRTWKYYKGGMADDIRIYDFNTHAITRITETPNQDIFPMWSGDIIYFLSDRDRIMNIFAYNTKTGQTEKVTNYTDYDVKFPSLGNGAIVYEYQGYIYSMDIATKQSRKVSIQIADDLLAGRNEIKDASKFIYSYEIAPDGKRALFNARGDVFTVPAENGITRNITQTSGAHERSAVWSPDGKYIAYLSDQSGEYEIYMRKQDGSEPPVQLTKGADTYKYRLEWSPDSKKILWNDKLMRLQYVDVSSKSVTRVDESTTWEFTDFSWSPNSQWITYTKPIPSGMSIIYLFDVMNGKNYPVTDEWYASRGSSFSDDGKYLLFISNRDFNPIYSNTEWNHTYRDMERIYLATLNKSVKSPFAAENDEVSIKEEPKQENKTSEKNVSKDPKQENKVPEKNVSKEPVKVEIEGIQARIISLPVEAGNYDHIRCVGDKVYYQFSAGRPGGRNLKMYDLSKKKETDLGKFTGFEISADGKKMIVGQQGSSYAIIDLPSASVKVEKTIDLSGMKVRVNNREEWNQIYFESWRQMRDFFYVPNMHGVNWPAMRDKYAVMLPWVNNRNDLNYLIGELIGELNVGHAYVNGGDKTVPERIPLGLLGAEVKKDQSGYYIIHKILKGQNWDKSMCSPLTEIGIDVKEGDYILAVDGTETNKMQDIYEAFIGKAGKQVQLTVNSSASLSGARKVIVVPIDDEADLYYFNWVQENIRKVNEATNGQVGYIHIPDMITTGLNEFARYFYPQLTKKALIIDGRGNGGGNVSPMIIERLMREVTRANTARNVREIYQTPRQMVIGPKVLLINQYSASDGDLFPYAFKKHQIGKVIGVTTWGGVVGIRGSLPFIDGADLRKPEFASYSSEESKWIIEGIGVEPDIWMDNDPYKEFIGTDDQLNEGIRVILEELKNYKELPPVPAPPDKSK